MTLPVWMYWEGDRPEWIQACQQTVGAHAPDVHLVTPLDFDRLRTADRDIDLSTLCTAHRADFIRAFLLAQHGGIWIDSDCVVLRNLQPVFDLLERYDFVGYKERQGYVSNNFMGAPNGSAILSRYYERVCRILRSGQQLSWLSLGSYALTETIAESNVPWYRLGYDLIQPVCWSTQPHSSGLAIAKGMSKCSINERTVICFLTTWSRVIRRRILSSRLWLKARSSLSCWTGRERKRRASNHGGLRWVQVTGSRFHSV